MVNTVTSTSVSLFRSRIYICIYFIFIFSQPVNYGTARSLETISRWDGMCSGLISVVRLSRKTRGRLVCVTLIIQGAVSLRASSSAPRKSAFTRNALVNSLIVYNPRTSENPSCSFESRVLVSDSILVAWKWCVRGKILSLFRNILIFLRIFLPREIFSR